MASVDARSQERRIGSAPFVLLNVIFPVLLNRDKRRLGRSSKCVEKRLLSSSRTRGCGRPLISISVDRCCPGSNVKSYAATDTTHRQKRLSRVTIRTERRSSERKRSHLLLKLRAASARGWPERNLHSALTISLIPDLHSLMSSKGTTPRWPLLFRDTSM
jgi:hypothetical protein